MEEKFDLSFVAGDLDNDFFDDFLQVVAFEGLAPYYKIEQTGIREGTSLGEHVFMGDMTIAKLKNICNLSDLEEKILLAAYTVHDMNKIERFSRDNIPLKKASDDDILEELSRVKFLEIFPEAEEYIEDISFLVRNHADKYHSMGGMMASSKKNYNLDKVRLEELLELIRGADIVDLSKEFAETYQKDKFLTKLNVVSDKQYHFAKHRISEHRGILSNIIHNAISDYLEQEYGWIPIFLYPEGTYYLVEGESEFGEDDFNKLANSIKNKVDIVIKSEFKSFINSVSSGIKVDPKCLELGISFEEILTVINNRIHTKSYNRDHHSKIWEKAEQKINKLDNKTAEEYKKFVGALTVKEFSQKEFETGELLRTYYVFLKDHTSLSTAKAWDGLYELLEVEEDIQAYFEVLSPLWYRAYIVSRYLMRKDKLDYETLYLLIKEEGSKLLTKLDDSQDRDSVFIRYLYRVLNINGYNFGAQDEFKANFDYYLDKPHKQCSTCSLDYEVDDWMSSDVADNIKVQFFSNRLKGGGGEPKRNICQICNKQFVLEKLNFISYSQTRTFYLHFYPKNFYPDVFLEVFQKTLNSLRSEDNNAILLQTDQIIKEQLAAEVEEEMKFICKQTKSNGNPLPEYSEVIGNIITLPLNSPGDNNTEQFIFALQQVLIWMRYFNFRAILSENPVPPLASNEFDNLYLDNLPFNLRGIIGKQNLTIQEAEQLWGNVKDFYDICTKVDGGTDRRKVYADLMRKASDNLLELFFALDRLITKKVDNEYLEIKISNQVLKPLERIISKGGGDEMETAKVMTKIGKLAAESYIKGKSFKRNSLLKPIDIIFDLLERRSEYIDLETIFATATQDIFDHIKRISPEGRKPGESKYQKIEDFVMAFKEDLLSEVYNDKVNELIADQKVLKSAYLFYYRKASKDK